MEFKHVGVVRAGVMGIGLAQNLAQTKHQVILLDISEEILANVMKQIKQNVRLSRLYNNRQEREPVADVMARITTTTDYALSKMLILWWKMRWKNGEPKKKSTHNWMWFALTIVFLWLILLVSLLPKLLLSPIVLTESWGCTL